MYAGDSCKQSTESDHPILNQALSTLPRFSVQLLECQITTLLCLQKGINDGESEMYSEAFSQLGSGQSTGIL